LVFDRARPVGAVNAEGRVTTVALSRANQKTGTNRWAKFADMRSSRTFAERFPGLMSTWRGRG
jgi:hypothetical protein